MCGSAVRDVIKLPETEYESSESMARPESARDQFAAGGRIDEVEVLWLNAGLSCDGDTIAMTAATQPSIEESVQGALPWAPRVKLHNAFLAYENGDEFVAAFDKAARGELGPFILVVEGSIPDESTSGEGYWASFGTDAAGEPITNCDWIDRLVPQAWAVVATGTCAAYGGIHAMQGNPTGCMGLPDYLGWEWRSRAASHRLRAGLPRAAGQHDGDATVPAPHGGRTFSDDSAGRLAAPRLAVRRDGARGL